MRATRNLDILILAGLVVIAMEARRLEGSLNNPSQEASRRLHEQFKTEWDFELEQFHLLYSVSSAK
jgi:hypothetical protein